MKRKPEPTKHCATCGQPMSRKRYNGTLEHFKAFLRRKYCSLSCANTKPEKTMDGWRWQARQKRKDACEVCGARSNLHAHHADHDVTNNAPENLQTLCGSCHATHHHSTRKHGKEISGKAALPE